MKREREDKETIKRMREAEEERGRRTDRGGGEEKKTRWE